jgi:hypothetical protein
MFIILLVLAAALGVGLGIVYNKLVIKNCPENDKSVYHVMSIILFLLCTAAFCGIMLGSWSLKRTITAQTNNLETYILGEYSDIPFVKDGLDMDQINADIATLNESINNLKDFLPSDTDLGVPKIFYDMAVNLVMKEIQTKLLVVDHTAKAASRFTDKNNMLTVTSITGGLRQIGIKIVNIAAIILASIVGLILVIYVIVTLVSANKEQKRIREEAPQTA